MRTGWQFEDLQLHQSRNDRAEQQNADSRCQCDSGDEQSSLGMVILDRSQQIHLLNSQANAVQQANYNRPHQGADQNRAPILHGFHGNTCNAVNPEQDELIQRQ